MAPPVLLLLAVLAAGSLVPSAAQGQNPYVAHHSMEPVNDDGERVRALRIPVYITLRSWQERPLGLRLRLAATFAAADVFELLDDPDFDRVEVLSFVPGLEFVVPVGRHSMLRPFFDAGIGTNDATKKVDFLGALGLRTEFLFPTGPNIFGLEPGVQFSFNSGSDVRRNSRGSSFISLTARRSFGFQIGDYPPDAGVYFDAGYNFQTFEYTSLSASGEVSTNLEVGADIGFSRGRPKIGPFRVPRLRVGYRFGDVEGFRIRVGGDWLITVAEQEAAEAREPPR